MTTLPTRSTAEDASLLARRTIFAGFRAAAERLWGDEALAQLGKHMPADCRSDTIEAPIAGREWYPERYVFNWYDAVLAGPAQGDRAVLLTFVDRMMDHGFGRIRKFLLSVVPPAKLYAQAAELWRYDHNTGDLVVLKCEPGEVVLELRGHIYCTTDIGRDTIAEIYRYAGSLSRISGPMSETHELTSAGNLLVTARWQSK